MNKPFFRVILLFTLLSGMFLTSPQAQPLNIILVESGPVNYNFQLLYGFAQDLYKQSFLTLPPPPDLQKAQQLWQWLGQHSRFQRLSFSVNGYYSYDWDKAKRRVLRESVRRRLEEQQDVDIIIALGTPAAFDMANMPTDKPVIVAGVTSPVEAGIVPSVSDSGKDNLVAVVQPKENQQQLEYFHKVIPFKRLGITYEDTDFGKSMLAFDEIEHTADILGFELVPCQANLFGEPELVTQSLLECHRQFAEKQADAVYLTYSSTLTAQQRSTTLEPLIEASIPTFSQALVEDVKYGALLSFVDSCISEGQFVANLLVKIAAGHMPRKLSQVFLSPKLLAVNLRTAALIGWNPPLDVLLSIDEIYE